MTNKKFGAYLSEEKILEQVAEQTGLLRSKRQKHKHDTYRCEWSRHPLAFLVEAADDICYGFIDLEDAVELRIFKFEQVAQEFRVFFSKKEWRSIENGFGPESQFRVNLARLRGPLFDKAVSGAIDGFMKGYETIMEGRHNGDLYELLDDNDLRKNLVSTAKKLGEEVFTDPKKVEIELGCYSTFETLLEAFCKAALDHAQSLRNREEMSVGWKSRLVLSLLGDHAPSDAKPPAGTEWSQYQCLRRVIDFVSGMTDNYATYIAKQLQGMGFSGMQRP